jgi:hypothetical protein
MFTQFMFSLLIALSCFGSSFAHAASCDQVSGNAETCRKCGWGKIHDYQVQIKNDQDEEGTIGERINACWSHAQELQKIATQALIEKTHNETHARDLEDQQKKMTELRAKQQELLTSLDNTQTLLEPVFPELVQAIQYFMKSNWESLERVLTDLNASLQSSADPVLQAQIRYKITILSDLNTVQSQLNGGKSALTDLVGTALIGNDTDRAKALAQFTPITQVLLRAVYATHGVSSSFDEIQIKATQSVAWTQGKLQGMDSEIDLARKTADSKANTFLGSKSNADLAFTQCENLVNRQMELPDEINAFQSKIDTTAVRKNF